MNITSVTGNPATLQTQALVTYVFDGDDAVTGRLGDLGASSELLRRLSKSGEMTGKMLEMNYLQAPQGISAERLLVVGAGKKAKFGTAELRKLTSAAFRYLKSRGVKKLVFVAREDFATADAAQAITEGLLLGDFEGDKYKTEGKKDQAVETAE